MNSSNARDLGGLSTDDGFNVRPGLVYRSDDTLWNGRALPAAMPAVVGTAIDLRRPSERRERGVPPFVGPATLALHESLIDESKSTLVRTDAELVQLYVDIFTEQRERLGGIMRRLAGEAPLPAVAYCAAGKDRTGITMAVLQRLLGVRRDEIVRDYARSEDYMAWVLSTGQLDHERRSSVVMPAHTARPETMAHFLTHLDTACGDADGLAATLGLDSPMLAALRARLLQPADAQASRIPA